MKATIRSTVLVAAAALTGVALGQNNSQQQQNQPQSKQGAGQQQQPRAIAGGQVDNRVGRELYGNGGPPAVDRYPHQVLLLPSEERYAIERSGALPSEIRTNADAVGALAPFGAGSYVPGQSALQRAVHARPPVLYGPAYGPQNPIPDDGPATPVPSPDLPRNPAPRTVETQSSPQYMPPQSVAAGHIIDRRVTPGAHPFDGAETVRYYKLPTRPATQPTTQPSLADQP